MNDDTDLDRLYRLAERLADELPNRRPDWCELAAIARELAGRLEARCRHETA
jgi:hypothetical protein